MLGGRYFKILFKRIKGGHKQMSFFEVKIEGLDSLEKDFEEHK